MVSNLETPRSGPSPYLGPLAILLAAVLGLSAVGRAASPPAAAQPARSEPASVSLVLLTLDTTRADYVGAYGAATARTPVLDRLAARGVRYATAITSSPLTLPAHASLLTGLDPPEHGVRDNGTAILPADLPTLATALAARGYATGAFVASRVLDRRFGLDRGFDVYGDRMAAEQVGQYGYPERDAAAVTAAALAWVSSLEAGKPYFLWVHYYDAHAPYQPPTTARASSVNDAYAGEIAYVDQAIGRLLAGLPQGERLVAAVGDHGEMLGEHGEDGHGIFLYRAALEVPLILAGPGIPAGLVVEETVATRRLAPTLLSLLSDSDRPTLPGSRLPGLGQKTPPVAAYSEARLSASAYGWASLSAITDGPWRLIVAPRPELYDLAADPAEAHDLLTDRGRAEGAQAEHRSAQTGRVARRLSTTLKALEANFEERRAAEPPTDPELEAQLRSLGYLSAVSGKEGTIDPKDGILLLADFERARQQLAAGDARGAATLLADLVAKNPGNVPFRSRLAAAQLATGQAEAAIATYRSAIELNPKLDFLHNNLADAYLQLGHVDQARQEYQLTLELNPRSAVAWLRLAELAARGGEAAEERRLLLEAVAADTASVAIASRLGQLELAAGETDAAESYLRQATELAPAWALPWFLRGQAAEARGEPNAATEFYRQAVTLAPESNEGRQARRRIAQLSVKE